MRRVIRVARQHVTLGGEPTAGIFDLCSKDGVTGGTRPARFEARWSSLTTMVSRSQQWPAPKQHGETTMKQYADVTGILKCVRGGCGRPHCAGSNDPQRTRCADRLVSDGRWRSVWWYGGPGRTRTCNQSVLSRRLEPLSYRPHQRVSRDSKPIDQARSR